jgi:hypothetical protein
MAQVRVAHFVTDGARSKLENVSRRAVQKKAARYLRAECGRSELHIGPPQPLAADAIPLGQAEGVDHIIALG